jgi:hypothetical protein
VKQSELPVWVWDMLIELEDQRDSHPELLFQAGGMPKPERYEWCSCRLLDRVPPEVVEHVWAIRDYVQAKEQAARAAESETAA